MSSIIILLADNDPAALEIYGEYLVSWGYNIITASNPYEAKKIFENAEIHLAIIDMRLKNDNDTDDKSGLYLAMETSRKIPKLIHTKYPTVGDIREALHINGDGLQTAIDFINKEQNIAILKEAIESAIKQYVNLGDD